LVKTLIDISVPTLTFIFLTAVGLDLTSKDFARVRRQPAVVVAGLVGPLVLLPPIAVGLAWIVRPAPEVTASLLLIAACPIGGISNTYSYLARASPALSVTLTGLSCLLAGLTMPLIGKGLEIAYARELDLAVPIPLLLGQLFLMLTLPVGFGMWVRQRWTSLTERYQPAIQRLAFAGVGIVLVLIILDNPGAFFGGLSTTVPLAGVFIVCSTAAGWMTAAMVTADRRDRFTLAAEFGTRNLGVAMAIAVTLLGRVEFARFAYTYFLTELPLMLVAIAWFRRHQASAVLRPAGIAEGDESMGPAFTTESRGTRS
jgi:BASS family bile acid:Na+ symporter